MRTTSGPVNDALFHFKDNTRSTVHYVGSGFSPTNLFAEARTDDPIPFDLLSTAGRVTVLPPVGEIHIPGPNTIAKVYTPDGKLLNTTGTTTSGLQEAFNYAAAHNLDVLVFGRGVRNARPRRSQDSRKAKGTIGRLGRTRKEPLCFSSVSGS